MNLVVHVIKSCETCFETEIYEIVHNLNLQSYNHIQCIYKSDILINLSVHLPINRSNDMNIFAKYDNIPMD